MLANFFCTFFLFVSNIKCTSGGATASRGAFYAADKWKKCAEKVNKNIISGCIVTIMTVGR